MSLLDNLSPTDLASIRPLSPEEEASLTPEPTSLLGRTGRQVANAPSDIYNDISRLIFNLGINVPGDKPVEIPKPYDIPPATTGGEATVDIVSELAKSIPLFLTGEGAGMGVARMAGAGEKLSAIARMAGGFALPGLAESREMGVEGAALGTAAGAASLLPARYRIPLAAGISAASGIGTYAATGDRVKAGQAALLGLPFLFGHGAKASAVQEAADAAIPRTAPENALTRIDATRDISDFGRYSVGDPSRSLMQIPPVAPLQPTADLVHIPPPPGSLVRTAGTVEGGFRPPEGSMVETPATKNLSNVIQFRRAPDGSLIEVKPPEGSIMQTDRTVEDGMIKPPPGSIAQTERTRQIQNLIRYIPDLPKPKMVQWAGKWMTEEEAQADLARTIEEAKNKKEQVRTQLTTESQINPKRSVMLKTILHPDDSEMIVKSAQKLGVDYEGQGIDGLNFTDPIHGGTFSVPEGATYKDLKNKVFQKREEFKANTPKAKVAGEQKLNRQIAEADQPKAKTPEPEEVHAYTQKEIETKGNPLGLKPALKYRKTGKIKVGKAGQSHTELVSKRDYNQDKLPDADFGFVDKDNNYLTRDEASRKVATLQSEKLKPTKPKTAKDLKAEVGKPNMVGTVPVKIEGREYHIVKKGKAWYDANNIQDDDAMAGHLAPTKQEAVRVLKQKHLSLPSSLENDAAAVNATVDKAAAFRVGNKVKADFGDGLEPAIVISHSPLEGITRVKSISSGEELDKYTHQVQPLSLTDEGVTVESKEDLYGTHEDRVLLEEQNQEKTSGGMRFRGEGRANESGAIPTDMALTLGRYVAIPLVGAAIGAALDEPDKRLRGAILGFAITGGLVYGGPRLIKALAEANPNVAKAGSVAAATKEAIDATLKAAKGDADMAAKVAKGRRTTGFDRIARWMEQHLHTDIDVTRVFGRTNEIELLGDTLHKAMTSLSRIGFTPIQRTAVTEYLTGLSNKATLDRAIGSEYGNMVSAAREMVTSLQKITTAGMKDGKLKTTIEKSYDEYLTTTYKFFTDPKYFPSDEAVFKAAKEMDASFGSMENRLDVLYDWIHKIQANRKQFKMAGGFGESLGSLLARKNPNLSPAFKEMLGIYDDPIQRLAVTGTKLVQAARSAKFFDEVSKGVRQNGLKMVYTAEEKDATRAALKHQLETAKRATPKTTEEALVQSEKVATLQEQIQDLSNYVWNDSNPTFGKLASTFVDRHVRDSLNTFDAVQTHFQSPTARAILKWTNRIKYGKILLSPLQFSRQVVTFPLLGIMAKTGPGDWARAYKTLFYNPAERARLTKIGVIWGDQVHGMLRKDLEAMMEGRLDDIIQNTLVKKGLHKWEEVFRTPDLLNRIAAFQKEENRLLSAGKSAPEAEDMAINYANRYTMNYAAVPPGIQKARQIPFLNQYLTFAYEAARIAKNLGEDAIYRKDPAAMAILTTMATAPFLLQKASEAMLSDKDREDWKRLEGLQQDYRRGNYNIVTGRDAKGNFHFINFTPIIVHDSWMKMAKDIVHLDGKALMSDNPLFGWDNTPLLNVASNMMTGTDLHTKQPLHSFADQFHAARREVAPPLLGTDLDRFVQALTPNAEGGLGVTDSRTGNSVTIAGMLASYLTSVRGYTSNLQNLQLGEVNNIKTEVQDMRGQLMKVLRTNVPQAIKDEVIQRYQQRVKQMFLELQEKVGSGQPSS